MIRCFINMIIAHFLKYQNDCPCQYITTPLVRRNRHWGNDTSSLWRRVFCQFLISAYLWKALISPNQRQAGRETQRKRHREWERAGMKPLEAQLQTHSALQSMRIYPAHTFRGILSHNARWWYRLGALAPGWGFPRSHALAHWLKICILECVH